MVVRTSVEPSVGISRRTGSIRPPPVTKSSTDTRIYAAEASIASALRAVSELLRMLMATEPVAEESAGDPFSASFPPPPQPLPMRMASRLATTTW